MNTTRTRALGLGLVAAVAMLALPAAAQAGRSHQVKLYKVDEQLDLEGQDGTYTVACPGGDLALDGMWRVDDVAQDNDYVYEGPGGSWSTAFDPPDNSGWDLLRSVRPVKVARAGDSSFAFRFTPEAGGDVSMKLFVTCLGNTAEPVGAHTVAWEIDDTSGGTATITTDALTSVPASGTGSCPTNYVVAQPSFEVTAGDADLVASYPSLNGRVWNWKFDNIATSTPAFSATVSWKCLELRSGTASSGPAHKHRLVRNMAKTFEPSTGLGPKRVDTKQAICGAHYKGLLGGWNVSGFASQVYYLGMDPRIKSRVLRFVNRDSAQRNPPTPLVCFKDRTT